MLYTLYCKMPAWEEWTRFHLQHNQSNVAPRNGPHPYYRLRLLPGDHVVCWCNSKTNSFNGFYELVQPDNDFTGPTAGAGPAMLAARQTRLPAPFPKFHPDAACAADLLKCKPQAQLCLLWFHRLSANTQYRHNVTITAGQYFNNNLFAQLQLHH